MTDQPPPINDEMASSSTADEWYYVQKGLRKGPVSSSEIKALLERKELEPADQVWRKGMKEWLSIRDSALGTFVDTAPPPVSGEHVSNALVWTVAIIPIVVGLIDVSLAAQPSAVLGRALEMHGGLSFREPEVPWFIPSMLSALLGIWDERRLKKAGYSSKWMVPFALLLTPVYLFVRAKRLKQRPTYAIIWMVLTVIAFVLVLAVRSA